jgi:hypothetical protein
VCENACPSLWASYDQIFLYHTCPDLAYLVIGLNAVELEPSLVTTSFSPPETIVANSQSSSKVLDADTRLVRSISASAPPDKEGAGNSFQQILKVPPAFDIPQSQTRIVPTAEVADNMDIDIASNCTTPDFSVSQEDVDMELSSSDEDNSSEESGESEDGDGSNMVDKQEISDAVLVQTVAHINAADAEVSDETRVLSASGSAVALEQEHDSSHTVLPKV